MCFSRVIFFSLLTLLLVAATGTLLTGTAKLLQVGKTNVWQDTLNATVFFTAGMNIDADGSPRAYHPVSDSGLDKLANAGKPGNWWGIVTEKGEPVIQGKDDPAPGYYVSCTSLQDGSKVISDPARYVDAETVPYFVLPNNKTLLATVKTGDIAFVKNLRNGKSAFAIFADVGGKDKIGEGSIFLAQQLGIDASPRTGGVRDSVLYVVFPGSGNGRPRSLSQIDSIGKLRLKEGMIESSNRQ